MKIVEPIEEIYGLLVQFSEEQKAEGLNIYGLKIYPGEILEWAIEDSTTKLGLVATGSGLSSCLNFLKLKVKNQESLPLNSDVSKIYELWRKYCPTHQDLYDCDREIYPLLILHPDSSITVEDCDSSIDWHGDIQKAIRVFESCIRLKCSFSETLKIFRDLINPAGQSHG